MTLDQFTVVEILLSKDQAEQLKIDVINAIENYGVENFDKKTEIDVSYDDTDPIQASVECKIKTIFKTPQTGLFEPPEPDEIEERSVHFLSIKLWNQAGDQVKYKVLEPDPFLYDHYITIEEQVKLHFTI